MLVDVVEATPTAYIYCAGATNQKVWKIRASDMVKIDESISHGSDIQVLTEDENYIYSAGSTQNAWKIQKSDMSKVDESSNYGAVITAITSDTDFIYIAGGGPKNIWKIWKSNMTTAATSVTYGDTIYGLTTDEDFVYMGGWTNKKVWKMWKSNLTKADESIAYPSTIRFMVIDANYVYCAGDNGAVWKIQTSDMSKTDECVGYGGTIFALTEDTDFVYCAGATNQKVWQIWKSNMTKKAESSNYGGDVRGLAEDTNYIYMAGHTTQKVWKLLKSDMSKIDESSDYGGDIRSISIIEDAPPPLAPPAQSGEVPANTSTGISLTPALYVLCTDANADNMNATWWSNSSGSWLQFASNSTATGFANNTNITQTFTNATAYSTTYHWSLNLTDGTYWTNETYHFTTVTNNAPTLSNEDPADDLGNVDINQATVSVTIEDIETTFNWTIQGQYITNTGADDASNGSKSANTITPLPYSTDIIWYVNVTDGTDWTNATYNFTTRSQYIPDPPSSFTATTISRSQIDISWTKGNKADKTYIRYKQGATAPTDRADGTFLYNDTGTSTSATELSSETQYSFKAWSWNDTDNCYSTSTATDDATTDSNNAPSLTDELPVNASTVSSSLSLLSITITDADSDTFNWTIETSPNVGSNSANDASDGSKTCSISGLSQSTTYLWYVNVTDSYGWTNETYHFTTNAIPHFSNELPEDTSSNIALQPTCNVTVTDDDGHQMTCDFYTSPDGSSWTHRQTNLTVLNESISYVYTGASTYSTIFYWKVTANDTYDNVSAIYYFTTKADPSGEEEEEEDDDPLKNIGTPDLTGIDLTLSNIVEGGFLGLGFGVYAALFGDFIWGLILGIIGVAVYTWKSNTYSLIGYLIAVLIFTKVVIPIGLADLMTILLALAITGLIYRVFIKKRKEKEG